MKQVDFYLISNRILDAKYKLASRLANKLQRLEKKALVVTDSVDATKELDRVMWSFNDTSFLAHDRLDADTLLTAIQIGEHDSVDAKVLEQDFDVLINLSNRVPLFNHSFLRIAEVVEAEEDAIVAGRARYKSYQSEGFELKTHQIEL